MRLAVLLMWSRMKAIVTEAAQRCRCLSGIFRDVYVLAHPAAAYIADYHVSTPMTFADDGSVQTLVLHVEVDVSAQVRCMLSVLVNSFIAAVCCYMHEIAVHPGLCLWSAALQMPRFQASCQPLGNSPVSGLCRWVMRLCRTSLG